MRSFFVFGLCFVAYATSRAAAQCAELPPIAVRSEEVTCLTQAALRERVAAYAAGGAACAGRSAQLSLQLTAAERRAEWVLLRAGAPVASRSFDALPAGCDELRDMLAVSIALALEHAAPDPLAEPHTARAARPAAAAVARAAPVELSATNADVPSQDAAPSDPAPPTSSAPPAPEAGASDSPREPAGLAHDPSPAPPRQTDRGAAPPQPSAAGARSSLHVYAGGEAQLFALSSPLWLGAAGLELSRGWLGVQLGGFGGGAAGLALGRGQADVTVAGAELYGCGGTRTAELRAQLCLGILGAGVFAQGEGFSSNLRATTGWGAAALALAVSWPRSSQLALRLSGRGLLNAVRPELQVAGRTESVLLARLGASARIELIFAWP